MLGISFLPLSMAYNDYATHSRITAKAVEVLQENDNNGDYAFFYNLDHLDENRFEDLHRGNDGPIYTLGDINDMILLSHPSAIGAVCEDESGERDGCKKTDVIRFNMHFINDRNKPLALPYYVFTHEESKINFAPDEEKTKLRDLLSMFGSGIGANPYPFYDINNLENQNYVDNGKTTFIYAEDVSGEKIIWILEHDAFYQTHKECQPNKPRKTPWCDYVTERIDDKDQQFINSYIWGLDGGSTPPTQHANMNWKGAIEAFQSGTKEGKLEALYRIGHVAHLIQDATVPEHVALTPHPGGGLTGSELAQKIQDNRNTIIVEIGRFLDNAVANRDFPVDCEGIRNQIQVGEDFADQLIAQANTLPDAMGYERKVAEDWSIQKFNSLETVPLYQKSKTLESYYDEAILSTKYYTADYGASIGFNGETDHIGGLKPLIEVKGLYLDTYTACPDVEVDLTIFLRLFPMITDSNSHIYLGIGENQVEKAVQLSSGLFKTFYDVVNEPPIIREFSVTSSDSSFSLKYEDEYVGQSSTSECHEFGYYSPFCFAEERNSVTTGDALVSLTNPNTIKVTFDNGPVTEDTVNSCFQDIVQNYDDVWDQINSANNAMQDLRDLNHPLIQLPEHGNIEDRVPSWYSQVSTWWIDGSIDDESFIYGMKFLLDEGIIKTYSLNFDNQFKQKNQKLSGDFSSSTEFRNIINSWVRDDITDSVMLSSILLPGSYTQQISQIGCEEIEIPVVSVVAKSKEPLNKKLIDFAPFLFNNEFIVYPAPRPAETDPNESYYYEMSIPITGSWVEETIGRTGSPLQTWEGNFAVPDFINDADYFIYINAIKNEPSFEDRNMSVKELDTDPTTIARVTHISPYDWNDYEPGNIVFIASNY